MTVQGHGTAAEVVRAHLAENVARLHEEEARVRSGETSAVHKVRIAARRLRTARAPRFSSGFSSDPAARCHPVTVLRRLRPLEL